MTYASTAQKKSTNPQTVRAKKILETAQPANFNLNIMYIISWIKKNRPYGEVKIESEMVQHAWPIMANQITHLFNMCLANSVFPTSITYGDLVLWLNSED